MRRRRFPSGLLTGGRSSLTGLGGELLLAVVEDAALGGARHGKDGPGLGWELAEGQRMGPAEFVLPLLEGEDLPVFRGDPAQAGHIGGGV